MMVFYCELAAGFCSDISNDDEGYFDALVRMFEQALKTTNTLAANVQGGLIARLDRVRSISHEFGYGVVDEAVLALLYLTTFKDKPNWRTWKGHNWDVLDRLHQKGYISDPATKARSVLLTEEGAKRSQDLFEKYFMK